MDLSVPVPFGQLLRAARLDAGWTQEALAERAGVSVRAIQALEGGRNTPQRDTVRRLAATLRLSPGALAEFEAAVRPAPRRRTAPVDASGTAPRPAPHVETAAPPTNLPPTLTSFVGRTRELAEVAALLDRTRLLTLVGTGGVGKTRLALQVAAAQRGRYAQGVWLVDLAPLTGPALLPQAVAAALGLQDDPVQTPLDLLVATLRARHVLLILDTCEHLLEACAHLAATLLRACPQVQILATSREPLRTAGEALWPVPPLALPAAGPPLSPDELLRSEAVRLFVERATMYQPHFALTAETGSSVAAICRQLDGIPLALELAAARVRGLGVAHLAERLDQRFRLLTAGSRAALPHQQTLRAMVDWSYALLTAQESLLFDHLAVFAGSFTLAAAEAVGAGASPAAGVLDLLLRLVDKSLSRCP
jgi:predicted ATPase/transcriptional regulator with XRE-family HTH domain